MTEHNFKFLFVCMGNTCRSPMAQAVFVKKIRGMAKFLQTSQSTVIPDPHIGGPKEFETVMGFLKVASEGLFKLLTKKARP